MQIVFQNIIKRFIPDNSNLFYSLYYTQRVLNVNIFLL